MLQWLRRRDSSGRRNEPVIVWGEKQYYVLQPSGVVQGQDGAFVAQVWQ